MIVLSLMITHGRTGLNQKLPQERAVALGLVTAKAAHREIGIPTQSCEQSD
jgi:hypothetical protein